MTEIKKAVLGSVRLDSDVWEAVRAMPESLNQYLRRQLVAQPETLADHVKAEQRRIAKAFNADPIDSPKVFGSGGGSEPELESMGTSEVLTSDLDVVGVRVTEGRGKATVEMRRLPVERWRRGPRQKGDAKR